MTAGAAETPPHTGPKPLPQPRNHHQYYGSGNSQHRGNANRDAMFVGVSHETSAFAVASIRPWWQREGSKRYPGKKHLLILADTGGSNSAPRGAWKDQLQRFCESLRTLHHGCSLPHRRIEIQPHRTTPVQPGQQQLGWRTADKLREDPEVHPHHNHHYRAQSAGFWQFPNWD